MDFIANPLSYPQNTPRIPGYVVRTPNILGSQTDSDHLGSIQGFGLDLDDNVALQKAFSEAIERYCLNIFKLTKFIHAKPPQLKDSQLVPLEKFILYSYRQYNQEDFPFKRFNLESVVYWTEGHSLLSGRKKLFPIDFIYQKSRFNYSKIDNINPSGSAAGKSKNSVILNGLCEVVERDSLMCSWLTNSSYFKMPFALIENQEIDELLLIIKEYNLKLSLYLIINEMYMITVVATLSSADPPYLSFGSSMKCNFFESVKKAILEAIMIRRTQSILIGKRKGCPKHIKHLEDHLYIPAIVKSKNLASKWLSNVPVLNLTKLNTILKNSPKNMDDLLEKLDFEGFDPYSIDISTQEVRDGGYFVYKTIIPGMHPLEINQSYLHEDVKRLESFIGRRISTINRRPHPYG